MMPLEFALMLYFVQATLVIFTCSTYLECNGRLLFIVSRGQRQQFEFFMDLPH